MKDEEMAEEYKRQFYGITSVFSFSDIEQAFLAGLRAGRPQWHDLRKDPNDLPTNTGLYLIFYYNAFFNDRVRCIARYLPDRKEFLNLSIEDGDEVVAWQELPAPPKLKE